MTLREECERELVRLGCINGSIGEVARVDIDELEAFAKRQRAAGLREALAHLMSLMHKDGSTDDQVWEHVDWCEAKAKEYET